MYSILMTCSCLKLCGQLEEEMLTFLLFTVSNKSKGQASVYKIGKKHVFNKKFPSVNVTKSAVSSGFGPICRGNP